MNNEIKIADAIVLLESGMDEQMRACHTEEREFLSPAEGEEEAMWQNLERLGNFIREGGRITSLSFRIRGFPKAKITVPENYPLRALKPSRQEIEVIGARFVQIIESRQGGDSEILLATQGLSRASDKSKKESLVFGDQRISISVQKVDEDRVRLVVTCMHKYLPEIVAMLLLTISALLASIAGWKLFYENVVKPRLAKLTVGVAAIAAVAIALMWFHRAEKIPIAKPTRVERPSSASDVVKKESDPPKSPKPKAMSEPRDPVTAPNFKQRSIQREGKVAHEGEHAVRDRFTGNKLTARITANNYREDARKTSLSPPDTAREGASKPVLSSQQRNVRVFIPITEIAGWENHTFPSGIRAEDLKLEVSEPQIEEIDGIPTGEVSVKLNLCLRDRIYGVLSPVKITLVGEAFQQVRARTANRQQIQDEVRKQLRSNETVTRSVCAEVRKMVWESPYAE